MRAKKMLWWMLALPSCWAIQNIVPATGHCQIATDGTLGPRGPLQGPHYQIPASLGKTAGGNLFHSFQEFKIDTGESATFGGPASINNILARVTGGNSSLINGKLSSTIPGANFYLINPSGVVFGPGAQLDVSGSFVVTTADCIKLGNDGRFDARTPENSVLTTASPAAFGFLSSKPASITVTGDNAQWAELRVAPGKAISLVGGDVQIVKSKLIAPAGRIDVVSLRSAGDVPADPAPTVPSSVERGDVQVSVASQINTDGESGGRINITAGSLRVSDVSTITSATTGSVDGQGIDLDITGAFNCIQSNISTNATGSAHGSDIHVKAGTLVIDGQNKPRGLMSLNTSGVGGDIVVEADSLSLLNGALMLSGAQGGANGGSIRVDARSITIDRMTSTLTTGLNALTLSGGAGGSIAIATESLNIVNGTITAASNSAGVGGGISIRATGDVSLNGGSIAANAKQTGNGGDLSLNAGTLQLFSSGSINVDAQGSALGGNLTIRAEEIHLEGGSISAIAKQSSSGGNLSIDAGTLHIGPGGAVSADTYGTRSSGALNIAVDTLRIDGTGASGFTGITTDSVGEGNSGLLTITADSLSICGNGQISSSAYRSGGSGGLRIATAGEVSVDGGGGTLTSIMANAYADGLTGPLVLNAGTINLVDGGRIEAGVFGGGDSGNIVVSATDQIIIRGHGTASGIMAQANRGPVLSEGHPGNVSVQAPVLRIESDGVISASTFANGDSGCVKVKAGRIYIDGTEMKVFTGVAATAEEGSAGNAGSIDLSADSLEIANGGQIAASTHGGGRGGDLMLRVKGDLRIDGGSGTLFTGITAQSGRKASSDSGDVSVTANNIDLRAGGAITTGTFSSHNGGDLSVIADGGITIDGSQSPEGQLTGISAQAELNSTGAGGTINIRTGTLQMTGGGQISADTLASGAGGDLKIKADDIYLEGSNPNNMTSITADSTCGGVAGRVSIDTGRLRLVNRGQIAASTFDNGASGGVMVLARDIHIDGAGNRKFTGITAQSNGQGSDRMAGNVHVRADRIRIDNSGAITSSTFGTDAGGHVSVKAGELRIDGRNASAFTGIGTISNGSGNAGQVDVRADRISIFSGGEISAATFGDGCGGQLNVTGRTSINIDGSGTSRFTGIGSQADTESTKDAGDVHVLTEQLQVTNHGRISARTFGEGDGGDLTVDAGRITLSKDGQITAATLGQGTGGDLRIQARQLQATDKGRISAQATGAGDGGSIHLGVIDTLDISCGGGVVSSSTGTGRAGEIVAQVGEGVYLRQGGLISVAADQADAGDITIRSNIIDLQESELTAQSEGNGGNITLLAPYMVQARESLVTARAGKEGGRINIDPVFVILDQSTIDGRSAGTPVEVVIDQSSLLLQGTDSQILTDKASLPPVVDLAGSLVALRAALLSPESRLQDRCGARYWGDVSSFIVLGRGGLPIEPGGCLPWFELRIPEEVGNRHH